MVMSSRLLKSAENVSWSLDWMSAWPGKSASLKQLMGPRVSGVGTWAVDVVLVEVVDVALVVVEVVLVTTALTGSEKSGGLPVG